MSFGPVQILVIGFDEPQFTGAIRAELERLREHDVVRLIDLIVVRKDDDGNVERLQHSDLSQEELEDFGAIVGALIGVGANGDDGATAGAVLGAAAMEDGHVFDSHDTWYVDDAIPPGTAAAVALLDHRWAIGLRDAIHEANGFHLADAWVHPADLVAIGMTKKEEEKAVSS
ncbi:MAG: hypothetical protein ACJ74X_03435 [Gaiellaceae bacterium]